MNRGLAVGGIASAAGAAAAAVVAGLLVSGRLTLDTRWGRSTHTVGPIVMRIAAPRGHVFAHLTRPYTAPASDTDEPTIATDTERNADVNGDGAATEIVERGSDLILASHHIPVGPLTAETLETVLIHPPERMRFRHVRGPVPYAVEEIDVHELGANEAEIEYRGKIGLDFWALGRFVAERWVVPFWEATVFDHLELIREACEAEPRESSVLTAGSPSVP